MTNGSKVLIYLSLLHFLSSYGNEMNLVHKSVCAKVIIEIVLGFKKKSRITLDLVNTQVSSELGTLLSLEFA